MSGVEKHGGILSNDERRGIEHSRQQQPQSPADHTFAGVPVLQLQQRLLAYLRRNFPGATDCDDLVQETLLDLHGRREQFNGFSHSKLVSYAICAARHCAIKSRRSAHRRRRREVRWLETGEGFTRSSEELLSRPRSVEQMLELAGVPEKLSAVIIACHVDGLGPAAAAAKLKTPVGTVKSRLRRAKSGLAILARSLAR